VAAEVAQTLDRRQGAALLTQVVEAVETQMLAVLVVQAVLVLLLSVTPAQFSSLLAGLSAELMVTLFTHLHQTALWPQQRQLLCFP
jgi:hypothetical protein